MGLPASSCNPGMSDFEYGDGVDLAGYDLLASAILLLSGRGKVEYASLAAEELLGLSRKQLVGLFGYLLFDADDALESRFLDAVNGRFGILRQDLSIVRGGVHVPVSLTVVPLYQQPWAALLELRELEHQALLDKMRNLGKDLEVQRESLRNLAHEVKNPLGGIKGAAQLLQAQLSLASQREYTAVIIAESDRLSHLVDRLIAPQADALHKEFFNIHEICERVYALVQAEFSGQLEFSRDYDISVPELCGDAARLLQALLNITRNAAQAVVEHDQTFRKLALRTRVGRQLMLAAGQAKMGIVVSVIDNGPGVPPDLHDKIFHPLVTGRASGSGLGLSLAQEYVQRHGGTIQFDTRAGHTEFRMILPLEAA